MQRKHRIAVETVEKGPPESSGRHRRHLPRPAGRSARRCRRSCGTRKGGGRRPAASRYDRHGRRRASGRHGSSGAKMNWFPGSAAASISARNPIARVDRPDPDQTDHRRFPPTRRCTSMPHPVNRASHDIAVRCSSKRNSGCACRSRRIACQFGLDCARLWISCIGVAPGLRRRCYRAGRSRGSTSGRTRTGRPMPVGRSPRLQYD